MLFRVTEQKENFLVETIENDEVLETGETESKSAVEVGHFIILLTRKHQK